MKKLKLKIQLALFNALSKAIIITLLIFIVPLLVNKIAINDTDDLLIQKLDKVTELIDSLGINSYIDKGADLKTFGSYNILKDEFISIEQINSDTLIDMIQHSQRYIDNEIVDYRVLSYSIIKNKNNYLIEIGKSLSTIYLFEQNLKQFSLLFLLVIIFLTIILDLSVIQYLLIPLEKIVAKLSSSKHPTTFNYNTVKTSTSDFIYLDETINALMHKIESAFYDERNYISNVSHELLTPVSIIQSKLDNILHESSLSEENMIKIYESKKTLRRLTNLVRTLLMMSRIENKEYILTEKVNVNKVIKNVCDEIEDKIIAKELDLKINLENSDFNIYGNENLIFILFYNFINNSIKYTEKGYIKINSYKNKDYFIVKISDTGIGIKKDKIPYIFSRHTNYSKTIDSYGLGLALSKKICNYHDITIDVSSKPNNGTSFILKFPVK